jgi:hypothetical protein
LFVSLIPFAQEFAMSLEKTYAVGVVRGIRALQKAILAGDLIADLNSIPEVELTERIGTFETAPARRIVANRLIDNRFLQIPGNAVASRTALAELRRDIPTGFDLATNRPRRNNTTASRYVQVAVNMGNLEMTAYARAVHFVARKRFATALCYAKRGQRVDMLIAHFLESF